MKNGARGRASHKAPVPWFVSHALCVVRREGHLKLKFGGAPAEPLECGRRFKNGFVIGFWPANVADVEGQAGLVFGISRRSHPARRMEAAVPALRVVKQFTLTIGRTVSGEGDETDPTRCGCGFHPPERRGRVGSRLRRPATPILVGGSEFGFVGDRVGFM